MIPNTKPSRDTPTPNSSSDSDQKSCKDSRRPQPSPKRSPSHDPATATTRHDHSRGGGTCGPFLRSYLKSQHPDKQVPWSDARRSASRRDGTKTDALGSSNEEGEGLSRGGAFGPKEGVFVRETRASRLRAASRTPPSDTCSAPPKPSKDRTQVSGTPTYGSLGRKDVDKSHSRKSHLNRSHTSEGVCHNLYVPGVSNVRRRSAKNISLEASTLKTNEKFASSCSTMGNANGISTHPNIPVQHLPHRTPTPKRIHDSKTTSPKPPTTPTSTLLPSPKHIDIATQAQILAASTLKMINRLDEINTKTRKSYPSNTPSDDPSSRPPPRDRTAFLNHDHKPSILKNKSPPASVPSHSPKPVSILKRKSLSQDDPQFAPPPVTFSPSVLNKHANTKRQGILKKRRSLDENEVMRRRSYSPDATYDFKSILKTQRRSSMEELTRRSRSPDAPPQGILKRKSSKEEDADEEPQGILKRKSLPALAPHHHVKITDPSLPGTGEVPENVRPILKKKSSSEDHSASDPSLSEVPKSILKKKTSAEAEDPEDKPMKPILKASRGASLEEPEEGKSEEPRPILKRENSRSGGEEGSVVRRRHERAHSSPEIDSELSAIFVKRRSLEFQPMCAITLGGGELARGKKTSSNERLKGGVFLSVAEKISNLENFLEVARTESPSRRGDEGETAKGEGGVGSRRGCGESLARMTMRLAALASPMSDSERTSPDSRTDDETSSFATPSPHCDRSLKSFISNDIDSDAKSRSSLKSRQDDSKTSTRSTDSKLILSPSSEGKSAERYDTDCYLSLDSCGDKISSLSLKETEVMDSESLFLLRKSGSVTAKASLFKEMEKKCKGDAAGENAKKAVRENPGICRRREKKLLESKSQRYHTQPVSTEEVELAVRRSRISNEDKRQEEGENHEDELCTMSYKDRLRFFESTLSPKLPEPRKRSARYQTQPVTSNEVETAKIQKSPAVVTLEVSHVDENRSEPSSEPLSTPRPKGILKNLSSEVKKANSDSDSVEGEKRGILKSELSESVQNLKKVLRKAEKEMASELKGILKQPSLEKKETSSSEEESAKEEQEASSRPRGGGLGTNLAALLQRVEPVVRGKGTEVIPKYMQNAGLARIINRTRNSSLIGKSQSHSSVSSARLIQAPPKCSHAEAGVGVNGGGRVEQRNGAVAGDEPDNFSFGLRRSTTQPLGPSDESTDDDMSGATIQERLARLKRSGELDWQKRKSHVSTVEDELSVITVGNYLLNEHSHMRQTAKEAEEVRNSSSVLADRLGKLDAAKEGWKKRVQPSDAVRFSVEGKMLEKRESLSPPNRTPLPSRKRRSPKAARFRSKGSKPCLRSMPTSPSENVGNPMARCLSAPGKGQEGLLGLTSGGDWKEANGPVVTVPKNDDETFTSFFEGLSSERLYQEPIEIKDEDLDAVTRMNSSQLLVQKRNIKTQRRRATVKNPVKALAARLDLQEYIEIKTSATDKELKRIRIEKVARNSTLAIEALAGLASREDFTAVSLKKPSDGPLGSPDAPYKHLMLLQVKGRRHVQTRLVEPVARSVNAGDCFILIAPNRLFHFVGEFANVIEKSRGSEICAHIQQTGDLGCTAGAVITIGEGGRATEEQVDEFWRLLAGEGDCLREAGDVDEDELFEAALVDTNMVYEVVHDELVPVDVYWGSIPKIDLLDPNKVLVLDFGSELYVWNGKNVSLEKRKAALKVARELWEEGFDYSECDICPLAASSRWGDIPACGKVGPARPPWALFAKITQNMETVLFREKFLDWPDYGRLISRGKDAAEQAESNGSPDIKPCDANAMLRNVVPEADLVLEGSHLGRGVSYFDEETRRYSEIATKDVTVWHVKEFEYSQVPENSLAQFHMGDSYVVRWHYVITITGRELSGQPSKHLTTGRNRYAYFFWQGQDSPINDKGAAACITVELDKEHGPQVRVVQGLEPPAFVNLFEGRMVVHRGRRCSGTPRERFRLFLCRGELESESVLFEMPCRMRHLRSFASFLLVNKDSGKVTVWHGCKSSDHARKIALNAARCLRPDTPEFEFTATELTIGEEVEGCESQDVMKALGGDNRQLYHSLLQEDIQVTTPRLFHLTSVSGEFVFAEVGSPHLRKGSPSPLPFLQTDLYSASQPALFLLDSCSGLWLWQGWCDDSSECGHVRFQAERRAAMTTALAYWTAKYGLTPPKAYLIWAGLEPLVFINQFPFWRDRDDVAEINMKDGRKPGEAVPVKTELASLTKSTYPLAQLLNRPLPHGVNPTSLEEYLQPHCFPDLFGMDKEDFLNLPSWKKKKLKQEVGLF